MPAGVSRARKPTFTLRIDEILRPDSAIAARKRTVAVGTKKSAEDMLVERKAKQVGKQVPRKPDTARGLYDAWADEGPAPKKRAVSGLVAPSAVVRRLPTTAASYNPAAEEHLAHLQELEAREVARLAQLEAHSRNAPQFVRGGGADAGPDFVEEANRALLEALAYRPEGAEDADEAGEASATCGALITAKPTRPRTTVERNRRKRRLQQQWKQQSEAVERGMLKAIDALDAEGRATPGPEDAAEATAAVLAEKGLLEEAVLQEQRLRRLRAQLPVQPLAIKLPEELPGSMRLLAAEGNLVAAQFRELVERGMVEPVAGLARTASDPFLRKRSADAARRARARTVVERRSFQRWE